MIEILIVLLVLGAATVVFYPALAGEDDPVAVDRKRQKRAATSPAEQDAMTALGERKERVFRNLRELDSERAAGRLAEAEYAEFKQRDEIEAARVLRDIAAAEGALKAGKAGRKAAKAGEVPARGGWGTRAAWIAGVAVFAVTLGIVMSKAIAPRTAGGTITGTIPGENQSGGQPGANGMMPNANPERLATLEREVARDSSNLKNLLEAGHLYLAAFRFNEAAQVTIKALTIDPRSAEASAHIAMLLVAEASTHESPDSAQQSYAGALQAINQAIKLDAKLPEAWLFKGMIMMQGLEDRAGAVEAWEQYLKIAPAGADTSRIAGMVRGFRRNQQ